RRDVVWLAHASSGANREIGRVGHAHGRFFGGTGQNSESRNRSTVHWIATGLAFTGLQQGGRMKAHTLSVALVGAWLLSFAGACDRKEPTTPPQISTLSAD